MGGGGSKDEEHLKTDPACTNFNHTVGSICPLQGRSYHIRKNAFSYTVEPNIWDFEDFLLIHIPNVRGKAILICLIPILVGLGSGCIKTPFEGLSVLIHIRSDKVI